MTPRRPPTEMPNERARTAMHEEYMRRFNRAQDRLRPELLRIRAQDPDMPPSPEDAALLVEMCHLYMQDWTVGLAPTGNPNEVLTTMWIQSPVLGAKPVQRTYRVQEVMLNGRKVLLPYHQGTWKRLVLALLEPLFVPPEEA